MPRPPLALHWRLGRFLVSDVLLQLGERSLSVNVRLHIIVNLKTGVSADPGNLSVSLLCSTSVLTQL